MGVIVDPNTGRLVSDAADKADIDVQVRVMVPVGDRPLDRGFGSSFFEALDGAPEVVDGLPASIQAALLDSPFYTFRNAIVQRVGTGLQIDLTIDRPEIEA